MVGARAAKYSVHAAIVDEPTNEAISNAIRFSGGRGTKVPGENHNTNLCHLLDNSQGDKRPRRRCRKVCRHRATAIIWTGQSSGCSSFRLRQPTISQISRNGNKRRLITDSFAPCRLMANERKGDRVTVSLVWGRLTQFATGNDLKPTRERIRDGALAHASRS